MKRLFLIAIGMIVTLTGSLAADFQPTIMKLTCPSEIEYHFNDKPLTIPFTISGTPGAVWLVINTKGQAENIVDVRNGYLGWHYVNKIDTTVYVSPRYERDIGETEIIWDGNNQDGEPVEAGTYDYYLWAYDDQSDRQLASDFVQIGHLVGSQFAHIYELDEDNLPLFKPLIMGSISPVISKVSNNRHGTHYKWELGSNPTDKNLLQTTLCAMYYPQQDRYILGAQNPDWVAYGGSVFDPNDYNTFYHPSLKFIETTEQGESYLQDYSTLLKFKFVTDGEAVIDQDWLGWDELTWMEINTGRRDHITSCYTDRNYIYITSPERSGYYEWNKLRCVSFDGEVIFDKMMHDWYMPEQRPLNGVFSNGSIEKLYSRGNNRWFLLGGLSCMHQMISTSRLIVDSDDETDMVVFENHNGDYFMDNCWQKNIDTPWFCLPGPGVIENGYGPSYECSILREAICIDSNHFNIIFVSWLGLPSFGISTQDGTGIDFMSFADDTVEESYLSSNKGGGQLCDNDSNYDGLYMNGPQKSSTWFNNAQTYFVAFDSVHGIITNKPTVVEEDKQIAFSVKQNTPNPFNPSTTIEFTLPEDNYVTVDIYNITGQKVDTLVNDHISAGKRSFTWDASGFSAGVYFYTVRSGVYEKTMKMTLLK